MKTNPKSLISVISTTAVLSTILAGCGAPTSNTAAVKSSAPVQKALGTVTIALSNDVDGLDPHKTASASTFEVTDNLYDTLVEIDPKGNLIPGLATEWKVSQDGTQWTLTLRSGVLFHNGKTMTADDVKYTFDRIMDKKTADPNSGDFSMIQSVTVNSPQQVMIKLTKPYAPFLSTLALPWAAIIEQGTGDNLKTKPVGTGPYELESWTPQQAIVLKRFANAWDAADAKLDTVKFNIVPDQSTQLMDLQSGSVDVAAIDPASAATVKSASNLYLIHTSANDVQVVAMNNQSAPLNDVRVRQAIEYAVNKADIIQAVDFGYGQAIGSHMPPISPNYVDLNSMYAFDVNKAKQLLTQAGHPNGLTLSMTLPQPYAIHVKTGQIIAEQLNQIGIKVNITVVPWAEWLKNVYAGRNYQMTVIDHTGRLDPAQLLARYQSNNKGNYFNYSNAKVDQDLQAAEQSLNDKDRQKLYNDVQTLLAKDAAAVYIQSPDRLLGINKRLQGWNNYPLDIYNMRGVSVSN